ncbi:MAG TPA: endonuclease III [Thermodesulfobacteriota bacterium]|nr:endonuclease III [Thermodesulfobacteriota bacterium]
MKDGDIHSVIKILKKETENWDVPIVTLTAETSHDPFRILISTILSLRTLDTTTAKVSKRLFELADTPEDMLKLSVGEIEKAIYPVGFYKTKARTILYICRELVEKYGSKVPGDMDELLKLKGVGRKTANLVVTLGYGKPGICVDTHVHRISNRLGYVKTRSPYETEMALREKLPEKYWIEYNDLLVSFGQHLCRPISPKCSECPIESYCDKVGVEKSR